LPGVVQQGVDYLAGAAIPIALMAVGATMDWGALVKLNRFTGGITAIKLVILPALTWAGVTLAGLPPVQANVLVVFSALPTASAAHVLASVYGAERRLPATLIAQSTLLSAATLTALDLLPDLSHFRNVPPPHPSPTTRRRSCQSHHSVSIHLRSL
jgi:malonate transporter